MGGEGIVIHAEAIFERRRKWAERLPASLGKHAFVAEMVPQDAFEDPETFLDLQIDTVTDILCKANQFKLANELHNKCLGFLLEKEMSADELRQFSWSFLEDNAPDLYEKAQAGRTRYT